MPWIAYLQPRNTPSELIAWTFCQFSTVVSRIAGTAGDAGIVDHDVEPAFALEDVGQQGLPGLLRCDVVHDESTDLSLSRALGQVGHDDGGSRRGEQGGRGGADARTAAGDDRHSPRKVHRSYRWKHSD